MNSVRYMYVRDKNRSRVGVIAMNREDNNVLKYHYSVLNPSDKFDRELGKRMALEQLSTQPNLVNFDTSVEISGHTISRTVMTDILEHSSSRKIPTRVVKFARSWLKHNNKLQAERAEQQENLS